jgi:hypothetical protein
MLEMLTITQQDCLICLQKIDDDLETNKPTISCGSSNYHHKCLEEWLRIKFSCPTCRTNCSAISSLELIQETSNPITENYVVENSTQYTDTNYNILIQILSYFVNDKITNMFILCLISNTIINFITIIIIDNFVNDLFHNWMVYLLVFKIIVNIYILYTRKRIFDIDHNNEFTYKYIINQILQIIIQLIIFLSIEKKYLRYVIPVQLFVHLDFLILIIIEKSIKLIVQFMNY